ncbi:hypothetical protein FACS1894160_0110 [Bacteroidia bacterium]|nr:hypothetical protein FACS1894123_03610 [Bacteroidia bacterium]GHV07476.1 hypothetical protein FACS1894160_0110 [Bacteroidia bacterium]
MKVRIITRRAGYNFGSSLQAYAIQRVIEKLGFQNEIIDYDELHHDIRWRIRPFIYDCLYRITRVFPVFLCSRFSFITFLERRHKQQDKFDSFERKTLKLTSKSYKTSKQIARDTKDVDICICGSDQIWSPHLFDPVMFLDFAANETKTIAYSPSLGVNKIERYREEITNLINKIDYISAREESGAVLVEQLTNRKVPITLDPTLLLDKEEWSLLQKEVSIKNRPYILCYFLGKENIPHNFILKLKEKTGMDVLNIEMFYNPTNIIADETLKTTSPDEFLWLTSNASYICTDSFHGTIFSILFERHFFAFERFLSTDRINQNSRIHTLLKNLEIESRLIDFRKSEITTNSIDYNNVNILLDKYRNLSIAYLQKSLTKI